MTSPRLEKLSLSLQTVLVDRLVSTNEHLGEMTIVLQSVHTLSVMEILRDHPELNFDTLIDVCGVDYSTYGAESPADANWQGKRFAAVYHLNIIADYVSKSLLMKTISRCWTRWWEFGRLPTGLNVRRSISLALFLRAIPISDAFSLIMVLSGTPSARIFH